MVYSHISGVTRQFFLIKRSLAIFSISSSLAVAALEGRASLPRRTSWILLTDISWKSATSLFSSLLVLNGYFARSGAGTQPGGLWSAWGSQIAA